MEEQPGIRIPADKLSPDVLRNVIEEFVTRDGTEFTDAEVKIARVMEALRRGDVEIWFDPETKSCSLHAV
ncbi:MAG: hypothetical protein ACI8X5_000483 [Planctomycetota bacterium]|jgi:uncharacterized protein YheU (UPF0270 family)